MIVVTPTGHTRGDLKWLRDKLWSARDAAKRVEAPGVTHVLQQPSGAVYTDRANAWTFNLSQARMFLPESAPILGASVVPFEQAREAIVQIYEANMRELEDALEQDRNGNYG